jgi:hypothetical protein
LQNTSTTETPAADGTGHVAGAPPSADDSDAMAAAAAAALTEPQQQAQQVPTTPAAITRTDEPTTMAAAMANAMIAAQVSQSGEFLLVFFVFIMYCFPHRSTTCRLGTSR